MGKTELDASQRAEFAETGILIIPGFYDVQKDILPIQRGIHDIIGQVMARHKIADRRAPFSPEPFDEGYNELIAIDRRWGAEIYDAVKQVPAFMRLLGHPAHETAMSALRKGAVCGIAAGGYGIRIDNPGEDKYRALWHQEYPSQLRSLDGLVFWSPLVAVTADMGPVVFCPRSHKEGPLPVVISDPDDSGRSGAYALRLHDEAKVLEKYQPIAPLTTPGDLVIIDFLLLHASGQNRSNRSRWSMQFRYFNFNEPVGRSHGWKGSFAAGVDFATIHPQLCISG